MGGLGIGELVVVLAIVTIFFGGKKLPELGSSMGQAVKNFKKGLNGDDDQSPRV
jgi:sec-independent protein translocase protein TatA